MDVLYTVTMSYPDGHLEEIEEVFRQYDDALQYGERMLEYVKSTESLINKKDFDDENELAPRKKQKPYFMVIENIGKDRRIVFESKH